MNIVIATPILYNEASPFNHLFKDIIGGLLEEDNKLIRLVAVEGNSEEAFSYGYTGKNIEYKLYKRKKSGHSNIISRYIRDSVTNIREAFGILKLKDVDVLLEDVSYSSFWSVLAAKIKRIKVVAMLQDVWPDNAVQSGLITEKSVLYKYFEMWQKYVYKNADKIICISDDMKAFIASKGISENKIEVIYNWGYSDDIVAIDWDENLFVKKYNLNSDVFYAVYAGNIGKMQNVEIVVNAAKELEDRKDVKFLIIGDGARKGDIEQMVSDYGITNVTILPMQPSELATHIYSAAGVNIIPLVQGGTKTALPSKTGVVLSCGKPSIYTYGNHSEFSKMIAKYNAGISVDASDSNALAQAIVEFCDRIVIDNESVYRVFLDYFRKNVNVKKYVNIIKSMGK